MGEVFALSVRVGTASADANQEDPGPTDANLVDNEDIKQYVVR